MAGKSVAPGRGRKAKPTRLKELAGNPGKRAINKSEPEFSQITDVEPPEWLDEIAATMWQLVVTELCAKQVLSVTDLHNVEVFCMAYRNWRQAQLEVVQFGVTIVDDNGKHYKNPALTAVNETSRQMATFGSLLGLDPSSRQRLIGGSKPENSNPFLDL